MKKKIFKKKMDIVLHFFIVLERNLQIEQIAQITQYDPWSAGIKLRSTQSDLTPWILTLDHT
jgi:hypothetical protein